MTTRHDSLSLTRRQMLAASILLGLTGCRVTRSTPKPSSDENLIGASALSGQPLSRERVRAMKVAFEFNLKHLETLREFDPDEEEPLTVFRL